MFAGGSTGSTTGGIKMARHLIALKNLRNVTVRLQHPSAVMPVKLNGQVVPDNINSLMTVFIQLYVIIFIAGMMVILITGIPAIEAAGASASALSCVGPGLGHPETWATMPTSTRCQADYGTADDHRPS
jgi:trk system potassium uptake protein